MGLRKHGPLFQRLIWIFLAALLCCYALCALLLGDDAPKTVRASVCKVGDGMTVSGFVVFEERAVGAGRLCPAVATGRHVAAGERVAWRCEQEQEALCAEKQQLLERLDALTAPTAGSDAEVKTALHRLALLPSAEAASEVQNRVLRREAVTLKPETLQAAVEALREQWRETDLPAVNASESGCFAYKRPSALTPKRLLGISPAEFLRLKLGQTPSCRLITGDRWYFAALLPEERELLPAQTLTVHLTPTLTVEMTVERLCTTPEGRLLVLSSRERLADAAALDRVRARLEFSSCEGLRVPKTAIRYHEGQTGVYVRTAGQIRFKPVTLLSEREDDFLAALTPADPAALREGDEMLLNPPY